MEAQQGLLELDRRLGRVLEAVMRLEDDGRGISQWQ